MAAPFPFSAGAVLTAAQLNTIGSYSVYTPVLTASITNPTLGTGSTQFGAYATVNGMCVGYGSIIFGTSGAAAGSGNYRVSLPLTGVGSEYSIGGGRIRDASAGYVAYVLEVGFDGTANRMNFQFGNGVALSVNANNPITFDNGDQIFFQFQYRLP
jgi:hypothetical protein